MGRLLRALALVFLVLASWWIGPLFAVAPDASPPPRQGTRIVSWNLGNFPRPDQDLERLASRLHDLDADIFVLQEIHDPDRLGLLLPRHHLIASEGGGRHGQRLVIAWDPERVRLRGEPVEDPALSLAGRVRPAFRATFETPRGSIVVVGIHLKAGADGLEERREQWVALAAHVELAARSTGAPVVLVGDYNTAGGRERSAESEVAELEALLGRAGLEQRAAPSDPDGRKVGHCTAYWEGVRRDGWWVPSTLDRVFTSPGPHTGTPRIWIGATCARHHCDPVRSTSAYPDPDLGTVSDHCPVVVDLG